MSDPKGTGVPNTSIPSPGVPAIQVGGRWMYPDNQGFLHPTPQEMISSNIQSEENNSRHPTGGNCGQDPKLVPNPFKDSGLKRK